MITTVKQMRDMLAKYPDGMPVVIEEETFVYSPNHQPRTKIMFLNGGVWLDEAMFDALLVSPEQKIEIPSYRVLVLS